MYIAIKQYTTEEPNPYYVQGSSIEPPTLSSTKKEVFVLYSKDKLIIFLAEAEKDKSSSYTYYSADLVFPKLVHSVGVEFAR